MAKVAGLPYTRAIVDVHGVFNTEGRVAFDELLNRIPITGSGTPEQFVDADAGATYYDLDATTGSIQYVKTLDDIDGDRSRGWILA